MLADIVAIIGSEFDSTDTIDPEVTQHLFELVTVSNFVCTSQMTWDCQVNFMTLTCPCLLTQKATQRIQM